MGTIEEKVQISLLRLLETRKLERIGGLRTISANVQIVVATNENLSEAVDQGRFREDLFFRRDFSKSPGHLCANVVGMSCC